MYGSGVGGGIGFGFGVGVGVGVVVGGGSVGVGGVGVRDVGVGVGSGGGVGVAIGGSEGDIADCFFLCAQYAKCIFDYLKTLLSAASRRNLGRMDLRNVGNFQSSGSQSLYS